MKYIRTKDGRIYEKSKVFVIKENDVEVVLLGISDDFIERTRGKTWNCGTNVILKQADTIEELIDEIVLGETKYHKPCVAKLPLDFLRECVITKTHYELVVYGSIWVDGNLVKVAKMNDKGELELL